MFIDHMPDSDECISYEYNEGKSPWSLEDAKKLLAETPNQKKVINE